MTCDFTKKPYINWGHSSFECQQKSVCVCILNGNVNYHVHIHPFIFAEQHDFCQARSPRLLTRKNGFVSVLWVSQNYGPWANPRTKPNVALMGQFWIATVKGYSKWRTIFSRLYENFCDKKHTQHWQETKIIILSHDGGASLQNGVFSLILHVL